MQLPPTTLTPQELELRAEVRAFLADRLPPEVRVGLGMGGAHDPEFSRALGAAGLLGMALPPEYGGRGGTAVERFIVTEELLAAQAPVAAHWVAERQSGPNILKYGTPEQKERFLPAIARGECFFSIGMSEPDAGSDLASVRTKADKVEGGWRINGTKVWTTHAHNNHFFAVLCRTSPVADDKHQGLSQLLVDLHADGVRISPILTMDGVAEFCEVALEDVFVPDSMVLGEIGSGWAQVTSELSFERAGPDRWLSPWGLITGLMSVLGPNPQPADAAAIGRMVARLRVVRSMSLAVARMIDTGGAPSLQASLTKDIGTVYEQDVVETVRSLLDRELDRADASGLNDLLVRAVLAGPTWTLRGGTTEILRSVVARGLRPKGATGR
ncbi:MAG TPA: acyl-CoA dehydrogenase family protein [Mycobacteriales bacterium]|nr:acyl-CoA dehydrogenase family protein [Mycobacteriales bacterium]